MKKIFKKKTMKKSTALIIVAVAMAVVGLVGFLSAGFTNNDVSTWLYERNPDNLLIADKVDYSDKLDTLTYSVNKQGVINITGTRSEDDSTFKKNIATVNLPAGEYILTCSDECSTKNYLIKGTYEKDGSTVVWVSDNSNTRVQTFDVDTEVTFSIEVYKTGNIDITARPVLNAGDTPIAFYVEKTFSK